MLLDEVTSALDPVLVAEVLDVDPRARRRRHDDGDRDPRDGLRPRRGEPGRVPRSGADRWRRDLPSRCSRAHARKRRGRSWTGSSPPAGCDRSRPRPCRRAALNWRAHAPLQDLLRVPSVGRPAGCHRTAGPGRSGGGEAGDAARSHGDREDVHGGPPGRAGPAPDPGDRPQQVTRRAARQRVPGGLPRQRGRVLRELLRLLPARGLRPADGHLHREGLVGQRRDRTAAPFGHGRAAVSPGRPDRGQRLVHLRARLPRAVRGAAPANGARAPSFRSSSRCSGSSTSSTSGTT